MKSEFLFGDFSTLEMGRCAYFASVEQKMARPDKAGGLLLESFCKPQ